MFFHVDNRSLNIYIPITSLIDTPIHDHIYNKKVKSVGMDSGPLFLHHRKTGIVETRFADFTKPVTRITQGVVIKYVYARYYEPESCFGLIVTARCDFANPTKSVPHIHYIPIVPLKKWVERELKPKIAKKHVANIYKSLRSEMFKQSISIDALAEISLHDVETKILNEKRHHGLLAQYKKYLKFKDEVESNATSEDLFNKIKNDIEIEIENIVSNRHMAYHFIPWLTESVTRDEDFICLFREIHNIETETALKLIDGVPPGLLFPKGAVFDSNELSYAYSEISSPDIENIIQRFSMLFSRVGVADRVEKKTVKTRVVS